MSALATSIEWQSARNFHGNLNPWLALGLRLGNLGLEETGAQGHTGVRVDVECRQETPISSMLDGLQLSTGATMGKRNLVAREGFPYQATVTCTRTGLSAKYVLNESLALLFRRLILEHGEDEAALRVFQLPEQELFARPTTPLPMIEVAVAP